MDEKGLHIIHVEGKHKNSLYMLQRRQLFPFDWALQRWTTRASLVINASFVQKKGLLLHSLPHILGKPFKYRLCLSHKITNGLRFDPVSISYFIIERRLRQQHVKGYWSTFCTKLKASHRIVYTASKTNNQLAGITLSETELKELHGAVMEQQEAGAVIQMHNIRNDNEKWTGHTYILITLIGSKQNYTVGVRLWFMQNSYKRIEKIENILTRYSCS